MYNCSLDRRRQLKLFIHLNVTFWGERYRKKVFVFFGGSTTCLFCYTKPRNETKQEENAKKYQQITTKERNVLC